MIDGDGEMEPSEVAGTLETDCIGIRLSTEKGLGVTDVDADAERDGEGDRVGFWVAKIEGKAEIDEEEEGGAGESDGMGLKGGKVRGKGEAGGGRVVLAETDEEDDNEGETVVVIDDDADDDGEGSEEELALVVGLALTDADS